MAYSVNPSPGDRLGGTRSGPRVGVWATGLLVVVMLMAAAFASSAQAASAPLGTADTFAVLGGSTVTNTGPSVISGDLGLSPGSAVTGFPPGLVTRVRQFRVCFGGLSSRFPSVCGGRALGRAGFHR